jgi:dUTP pyrophosphatase
MSEKISIKIKRINLNYDDIPLPSYATEGSAGMDIRAAVENELIVKPSQVVLVPTNLSVEIPSGFEIQVRPRSGLAANNSVGILNSPGTIDSDYRGEIKIILMNFGKEDFKINRGDRIAQLVAAKIYRASLDETNVLNNSKRGKGGFGHTGQK